MRNLATISILGGVFGVALSPAAMAQVQPGATRAVFPDDSVVAHDALIRVRELAGAGNAGEALRVLQGVLDTEADKVLPSDADPDVYLPVRALANQLLLADPALLAKYRELEGPEAQTLLTRDDLAGVERTRFLTPAGFEAALRLAQIDFEAARFNAAFLTLAQVGPHPDRAGDKAKDAARLLERVARFVPRADVFKLLEQWQHDAGLPLTHPEGVPPAPELAAASRTSLDPLPPITQASINPEALQQVGLDPLMDIGDEHGGKLAWVLPSVVGDRVYVNDGSWIRCLDAATLAQRWAQRPDRNAGRALAASDQVFGFIGYQPGLPEDMASVTVANGVAIAPGGIAIGGVRTRDRRVHAFDASTGRPLWTEDVATLDDHLRDTIAMGPVVVDGDVAVLGMRKTNVSKRVNALYLAGVDLYTGGLRWWRLVASIGTNPWGRATTRPDAATLDGGIVYRADEMGVIGAYRADNGRPVWVRLGASSARANDPQQIRMLMQTPPAPYNMTAPVVAGGSVFCVEPGRGRVIELDAANGRLKSSRDGAALDDPKYLLRVGDQLACVSATRVVFVPLAELESGKISMTPPQNQPPIVGRACVAGDRVLLPLEGQVLIISPEAPADAERVDVAGMGNLVVADVPGATPHLIAAGWQNVSSFMKWDVASALLEARITRNPGDPDPLLTSIELLKRAAKIDRVPPLADRVLTLLDANPTSDRSLSLRGRLFDLLLGMIRDAAASMNAAKSDAGEEHPPPAADLARLDAIAQRLERCAESPDQLAAMSFQLAWLREAQSRPEQAVEQYQRVLLDPALAELHPAWLTSDEDGAATSPRAGDEAARRLRLVLRHAGPKAYDAFDEEAAAQFKDAAGASPEDLITLARRYPAASVTPQIYLAAARAFGDRHRVQDARLALGAGLAAAELSASIGRPDEQGGLPSLLSALLAASPDVYQQAPIYRVLSRIGRERPGLSLSGKAGVAEGVDQALRTLRERLLARPARPHLGPVIAPRAQAIEGWETLDPMMHTQPGVSCDSVMMYNEAREQTALWAVRAEDGQLRPLWYRKSKSRPSVLRVGLDSTLMYWPSPRGGRVESVGPDGATQWRTDELSTLFGAAGDPNERIPTPMDGQVRPDDLLFAVQGEVLCLVQRCGKAAGVSLRDGATLWNTTLPATRVYELSGVGDSVMVAGSQHQDTQDAPWGAFAGAINLSNGQMRSTIARDALGDHVRWIRPVPGGDALIGTSDGVMRVDPADGSVRWHTKYDPARTAIASWVLTSSAYMLDGDMALHRVNLASGDIGAVDGIRSKLTLPVIASPKADSLALGSTRGMIVLDDAGNLIGADALDDQARIEPPAIGDNLCVAIESPDRELGGVESDTFVARLYLFERPGGRLAALERIKLYDVPRSITLLDGKILIGQGSATLVLEASDDSPPGEAPQK
ncbi:MAG: PQQ-binding-like beta-propeller repeat protein [Tepidisphaera sp.]|nr:PQQ-binding-like beta-propeller repeat protein [Tepidisphaera sp.]